MIASIAKSLAIASLSFALYSGQVINAEEVEYKNAHVLSNVLSENAIAGLANEVGTNRLLRGVNGNNEGIKNRQYSEAELSNEDIQYFLNSIGDKRPIRVGMMNFRTTLITGSTNPHKDMKVSGNGFEDDEEVMFVFLNDNEGAYFQIGEDKIPAKKGTMIKFNGNRVLHNTIVPSGTDVRLLGPIDSRDLEAVGDGSGPSPGPTTSWEGAISHVIDTLIGLLLGHKEDDLIDPSARGDILAQLSTGPLADWISPSDVDGSGVPTAVVALVVGCGVDLDVMASGGTPSPSSMICLSQAFNLPMATEGIEGIEALGDMSMSMP